MAVILYLPDENGSGASLGKIVKAAIPDRQIELYHSINALTKRLHRPLLDIDLAVLYAASSMHLLEIFYLAEILEGIRIVLIVSDDRPETLKMAHMLRPRFVTSAESDFLHLGIILKKMTNSCEATHNA